jgi:hypothetical protein
MDFSMLIRNSRRETNMQELKTLKEKAEEKAEELEVKTLPRSGTLEEPLAAAESAVAKPVAEAAEEIEPVAEQPEAAEPAAGPVAEPSEVKEPVAESAAEAEAATEEEEAGGVLESKTEPEELDVSRIVEEQELTQSEMDEQKIAELLHDEQVKNILNGKFDGIGDEKIMKTLKTVIQHCINQMEDKTKQAAKRKEFKNKMRHADKFVLLEFCFKFTSAPSAYKHFPVFMYPFHLVKDLLKLQEKLKGHMVRMPQYEKLHKVCHMSTKLIDSSGNGESKAAELEEVNKELDDLQDYLSQLKVLLETQLNAGNGLTHAQVIYVSEFVKFHRCFMNGGWGLPKGDKFNIFAIFATDFHNILNTHKDQLDKFIVKNKALSDNIMKLYKNAQSVKDFLMHNIDNDLRSQILNHEHYHRGVIDRYRRSDDRLNYEGTEQISDLRRIGPLNKYDVEFAVLYAIYLNFFKFLFSTPETERNIGEQAYYLFEHFSKLHFDGEMIALGREIITKLNFRKFN